MVKEFIELGDHNEVLWHAAASGDASAEGSVQAVESKEVDLSVGSPDLAAVGGQRDNK